MHEVAEIAEIAIDVAALLGAALFWPAPRSGFSVHVAALRSCARGGLCDPARAACVTFSSSGCGGRFPPELLHPPGGGGAAKSGRGRYHLQLAARRPQPLPQQPARFDAEEQAELAAQAEAARQDTLGTKHRRVKHASYEYPCPREVQPPQPVPCANMSEQGVAD